jgi:hypothetical protein
MWSVYESLVNEQEKMSQNVGRNWEEMFTPETLEAFQKTCAYNAAQYALVDVDREVQQEQSTSSVDNDVNIVRIAKHLHNAKRTSRGKYSNLGVVGHKSPGLRVKLKHDAEALMVTVTLDDEKFDAYVIASSTEYVTLATIGDECAGIDIDFTDIFKASTKISVYLVQNVHVDQQVLNSVRKATRTDYQIQDNKRSEHEMNALMSCDKSDFTECAVLIGKTRRRVPAFLCIDGPLKGVVCDEDMVFTFMKRVHYWNGGKWDEDLKKWINPKWKFQVMSESLSKKSLMVDHSTWKVLTPTGRARMSTDKMQCLHECFDGSGANIICGDKTRSVEGVKVLLRAFHTSDTYHGGLRINTYNAALWLTRRILQSPLQPSILGKFYFCPSQV